eukprot:TRINITY_DN8563_c0_g3_i3.p1 TRINITY_DN8563_c0_g3~~TRINITY_DN8563_c0_g3_i3.p1  ORF type:complete len:475 (+),score=124.52 TRINITY_DN8563_c0_g3_i3:190-1614(+)
MEEKKIISALCWVSKGFARKIPKTYQINEKEIEEMKSDPMLKDSIGGKKKMDDDLDMDNYDDEDEMPIFAKETKMDEVPNDNLPFGIDLESDEEKDDYEIKKSDAVLVAAKIENDFSSLEIYVYEEDKYNLFVHHDIMLSSFPLCIEWLSVDPTSFAEDSAQKGNYLIVGSFLPGIEIWDMDLIDALEPTLVLGGEALATGKKIKKFKEINGLKPESHTDAVISLSVNKFRKNILCSGSADSTIKIWDISNGSCVHTYDIHSGKLQVVRWNPQEEAAVLSGASDRMISVMDVTKDNTRVSTQAPYEIESAAWDPFNKFNFLVSYDNGRIQYYDARKIETPVVDFQAHDRSVTSMAVNPVIPGFLVTTSLDGCVKAWDLLKMQEAAPHCVASKKIKAGKLFCGSFYEDSPWLYACGTSKNEVFVWDSTEHLSIVESFGQRAPAHLQPDVKQCNKSGQDYNFYPEEMAEDDDQQCV